MDIFKDSKMGLNGHDADRPSTRQGNHQELTLSYLMGTSSTKGKEIVVEENQHDGRGEMKCVERDFLNLGKGSELPAKREATEEPEQGTEDSGRREKKMKLENTLNLSLALPSASLFLTASSVHRNAMPSAAPHGYITFSNDLTSPSMSHSCSHPFSHNPSCSLTCNSTENFEFSTGKDDHIWCGGGEGTNGSVHSRFKPIGVASTALTDSRNFLTQGGSFYRTGSANYSENILYFPSELPARPNEEATVSGDSVRRYSNVVKEHERIMKKASLPERLIREIVTESVPVMAQIMAELPDEVLQSSKDCLKTLIETSERKEELLGLRSSLNDRADLTKEALLKCHREQLNIMVSVRTGLGSFLSDKIRVTTSDLIEIFLYMRCWNLNCKSLLPVDDCECKICSVNKGFCSSCMCPVCFNFDCASETCSWVGCDVCSHWCHASCGLQQNLIKPGLSLRGPAGTTEMQFHCVGCDHASEMFGFVKDVFTCCAKSWGLETLTKELNCVKVIFQMSQDFRGKELHRKADDLLLKLGRKLLSTSDACNMIIKFMNYTESECAASAALSSRSNKFAPSSFGNDMFQWPPATADFQKGVVKSSLLFGDDKLVISASSKGGSGLGEDVFDSIESVIRIKEAESQMFQNIAEEARKEAEMYKEMVRVTMDKLEEDYAQRFAKLRLQETEEHRRKMLEDLMALENSHCDYQNMKIKMQTEIAGMWDRIEPTRQQLA
ncbi:hypothetical protein SAY86_009045 [Trapa natans]|uniref:OBERON-like protein n=1 Tax=Trapa natans TaxID=22666 RepID=A0AAN7QC03_TRANT|nr:hypothetical protein SAY86_009045 [Trapa natans]